MKKLLLIAITLFSIHGISQSLDDTGYNAFIQAPKVPTYGAATTGGFTPDTRPNVVCSIYGSTTKKVLVYKVRLSSTQTTAGTNFWRLIKKSSLDGGGSSTNLASVMFDSGVPASSFGGTSVKSWTANPSVPGSSLGNVRAANIFSPAPATASNYLPYEFDFSPSSGGRPIVLNSASEGLVLDFNGAAAPAGLSVNCDFLYVEARP